MSPVAQFLPRDAMRSLRSSGVCLSRRPYCIHGWRYRNILLITSVTSFSVRYPHHSRFWPLSPVPNSKGTLEQCAKHTVVGKNLRLSTEIVLYLGNGTRYALGCYGTLIGSRSDGSIWVGSDDLEWPWKAGREGSNIEADLLITLAPFDLERPNPARWQNVGEERISRVSQAPTAKRAVLQCFPILEVPICLCSLPLFIYLFVYLFIYFIIQSINQ